MPTQEVQGFGDPDGMYLSKPVMMRPSTRVTTRNEMVHSVIVQPNNRGSTHSAWKQHSDGAAGAGFGGQVESGLI